MIGQIFRLFLYKYSQKYTHIQPPYKAYFCHGRRDSSSGHIIYYNDYTLFLRDLLLRHMNITTKKIQKLFTD